MLTNEFNTNKPLIVGNKTFLSTFNLDDITPAHISWLNDRLVTQYSEQRHIQHSYETCFSYLKSFENSNNLFLSIKIKATCASIGSLTVYHDIHNQIADMGILIGDKDSWNGGFGFDAWFYTMEFLKTKRTLRKISCGTLESNLPMIKLAEKSGMSYDGKRQKHALHKGKALNILFFAKYL